MKVKELIEKLQMVDPDAEAGILDARKTEEWDNGRVKGAVCEELVPIDSLRVTYNDADRRFVILEADTRAIDDMVDALNKISDLEDELRVAREEAGQ
jgi:rhodanese-related sulfurtransferase